MSAPSHVGSAPHLIYGSLDWHLSHPISIGSVVIAQLTHVTDTQTMLHATSIAIGRIYSLCAGAAA